MADAVTDDIREASLDLRRRIRRASWLRKQRWRIKARPKDGPPLWVRDGLVLSEFEIDQAIEEAACRGR